MELQNTGIEILEELGARPSISEERGLALMKAADLTIFSPGISTGGFAEIRMARGIPNRKIVATTIDEKGLRFAEEIIKRIGNENQIETRLEDLRGDWPYPENYFDFIYARLVLHYLSRQDLDRVLVNFSKSLKPDGRIFTVVRSEKNVGRNDLNVSYDPETSLTKVIYRNKEGKIEGSSTRYFHTPESISRHLEKAGFKIERLEEYDEQLYKDFMRKEVSPRKDQVIEVLGVKPKA